MDTDSGSRQRAAFFVGDEQEGSRMGAEIRPWPQDFTVRTDIFGDEYVASDTAASERDGVGDRGVVLYLPRVDDGRESRPDVDGLLLRLGTWEQMRTALKELLDEYERSASGQEKHSPAQRLAKEVLAAAESDKASVMEAGLER